MTFPKLSPAENLVAEKLLECLTNKEIGDKLHISTWTVKFHICNITRKLGIYSNRSKMILTLAKMAGIVIVILILTIPMLAQHSATVTWTQPVQPTGETVASTQVKKDGTTIATVAPTILTVTDTAVTAGQTVTYSATNTDAKGAVSGPSNSMTVVIPGAPPPPPPPPPGGPLYSLFASTIVPGNITGNDSASVELGVQFTSSSAGQIVGVKFYKVANSTGTHTGTLWSAAKAKLATGTFVNETASGWQTLTFAAPISITAGTIYTASVHTVQYAWNANYFTVPVSVPPLTTPINAGVYIYGTASAFPSGTYQASNYFVDVLFLPGAPVVGMAISCTTAATGVSNLPTGAYTMSVTSGAKTVSCSGTN